MTIVAEAVVKSFHADKMNDELLGNGDMYLHWHLFLRKARYIGTYGHQGKGSVWWYPMENMYADRERPSPEDLGVMKERLLQELQHFF